MFVSVALPAVPSWYVPETTVPVKGIASCNNVFVETISLLENVLYVDAIISPSYYVFLMYLTGMSMDDPVVTPVTLITESMALHVLLFTVTVLAKPIKSNR